MAGVQPHPNILIIVSDQHRADAFSHAGDPNVLTPNFDRVAGEGVRMSNCFSAAPICGPFQATLQTGLYYFQHGQYNWNVPVNQNCRSMADHFHAAGYQTCYIGKCNWAGPDKPGLVPPDQRFRWQNWFGHNHGHYYYDWPVFDENGERTHEFRKQFEPHAQTTRALEWISQNQEAAPWVIQMNWGAPHPETQENWTGTEEYRDAMIELNQELRFNRDPTLFQDPERRDFQDEFPQHLTGQLCPDEFLDMYDPDTIRIDETVPEEDQQITRYWLKDYYALISAIDYELGRVLSFLEDSGLSENTLVIYTSDHGDFVGSHGYGRSKAAPHQQVCRVPLLAWGADLAKGRMHEPLISTVDLLPTILELALLPTDYALPGISQANWFINGNGPRQSDIVMSLPGWRAICNSSYLFAIQVENEQWCIRHLIDMKSDPLDQYDLSDDPGYAETLERLQTRLIQRMVMVGDQEFYE